MITHVFLMNEAIENGMCLHIYSFPSCAFLEYQTSRFVVHVPQANLVPLLAFFARIHFAKLPFHCLLREYLTGCRYFIHKDGIMLLAH